MSKLKLEIQLSLDGYIASSNGNTNWMIWNWGPDWNWDKKLREYTTNLILSAEHFLISRQMAEEGFMDHWQNAAKNNKSTQYTFAKHIYETHKIVFSKSLNKNIPIPGGWENSDIVNDDFVKVIKKLKKDSSKDIIAFGGSNFVSSLIKEKLIDEYHLYINPVAIGKGLPIFHNLNNIQQLKLISSQSFDCGIVVLVYKLL